MRFHLCELLSAGIVLMCCATSAASEDVAATLAGDPAIAAKLNEAGYAYRIDKDGDYAVVVNFQSEKRSQQVFISSKTRTAQGINVRDLFSFSATEMKKQDRAKLEELMHENWRMKIGSWSLIGDHLAFTIQLQGGFSAKDLADAISIAATVADNKEIEFTDEADKL